LLGGIVPFQEVGAWFRELIQFSPEIGH
jgi:hypothetical protein